MFVNIVLLVLVLIAGVAILHLLRQIKGKEANIMSDLTALTQAVTDIETVDQSVEALITQLVEEIKAAGTDQTALDALTTRLENEKTALAEAVTANTPTE